MTADERRRLARAKDPEWWAEYDAFHNSPIDRSPEGQAKHERLTREHAERMAPVREKPDVRID